MRINDEKNKWKLKKKIIQGGFFFFVFGDIIKNAKEVKTEILVLHFIIKVEKNKNI